MHRFKKKTLVILTMALVLVLGGIAFAYWTNTGSGTGTATTGNNNAVVINQTSEITGLAPGQPAQTLSGTFDNPNPSPVYIGSVTAVVTGTDIGAACDATNYAIAGAAPVNAEVPPGEDVGTWSGLTIQFVNKPAVNQDACKNAVVQIAYTATAG